MSHVTTSPEAAAAAQTLFRVALGGVLIARGSQKLFGWFGGGGIEGTSKGMHAMGFRPAKPGAILAGGGESGAGVALALWLATPAAGAAAATTMGVAASVHAPTGFFATEGGFEYPAVLGLAAASFTIGGPGPFSLDSLTGHVLDRPWMRVAALAVNRLPSRSRSTARCKALAEDTVAPASGTPVEEASAQPHTPPRVPFGRAKQSGYGLEFGVEGLKQLGAPQVISY